MKWFDLFIRYRFWISIVVLVLAVTVNITSGFWPSFILYLAGVIMRFSHFFFGPRRISRCRVGEGNREETEKVLNMVWFPGLLYKPVQSVFYTLKGNIAMMKQDFDSAEKHMKKSLDLGVPMKEAEGANKLQLGMMAMQRGDMRQGETLIRAAIKAGIPDKDSLAMAYLQMCQIMAQKREFRSSKDFFKKAKATKPTNPQVVEQLKNLEKYISRMPG